MGVLSASFVHELVVESPGLGLWRGQGTPQSVGSGSERISVWAVVTLESERPKIL